MLGRGGRKPPTHHEQTHPLSMTASNITPPGDHRAESDTKKQRLEAAEQPQGTCPNAATLPDGVVLRELTADAFLALLKRPCAPRKSLPSRKPGESGGFPVFQAAAIKPEALQWPVTPPEGGLQAGQHTQFQDQALAGEDLLLWVDWDGSPFSGAAELLTCIATAGLALPVAIVHTSAHNWHAYWLVDGALPRTTIEAARQQLAAIFQPLGADKQVATGARAMRLPDGHRRADGTYCTAWAVRRAHADGRDRRQKPLPRNRVIVLAGAHWESSGPTGPTAPPGPCGAEQPADSTAQADGGLREHSYRLTEQHLLIAVSAMPAWLPGTKTRNEYRDMVWSTLCAAHEARIPLSFAKGALAQRYAVRQSDGSTDVETLHKQWNPQKIGPEKFWKHFWGACGHLAPEAHRRAVEYLPEPPEMVPVVTVETTARSLADYLTPELAGWIQDSVWGLQAEPELLALLHLLTTAAVLRGYHTVGIDCGHVAPLNLYAAICGPPGSAKSPLLRKLVHQPLDSPIFVMDDEGAHETTLMKLAQLDGPYPWPDPHLPRQEKDKRPSVDCHLTASQGTSEGLAKHLAICQQPKAADGETERHITCLTMVCDELMGWLGNVGAYSTGRGQGSSEVASMLSYYDGYGRTALNAGVEHRCIVPHRVRFQIVGCIQPEKLAGLKGSGALAGGGFWARLLIIPVGRPMTEEEKPEPPSDPNKVMGDLANHFYDLWEKSPMWAGTWRLGPQARKQWGDLKDRLLLDWENRVGLEAELRAKEASLACRLAALIHCAKGLGGKREITSETFALGANLASWAVEATLASHSSAEPEQLTLVDWRRECLPAGGNCELAWIRKSHQEWGRGQKNLKPLPKRFFSTDFGPGARPGRWYVNGTRKHGWVFDPIDIDSNAANTGL